MACEIVKSHFLHFISFAFSQYRSCANTFCRVIVKDSTIFLLPSSPFPPPKWDWLLCRSANNDTYVNHLRKRNGNSTENKHQLADDAINESTTRLNHEWLLEHFQFVGFSTVLGSLFALVKCLPNWSALVEAISQRASQFKRFHSYLFVE